MVARPAQIPSWATDPNYPAGSDAWSGTPTRVEPAAAQKGTGLVPAERPPAQFLNWISGLFGDWVSLFAAIIDSDEEHTYQTPKTRTMIIGPRRGNGEAGWEYHQIGYASCTVNGADLFIDLSDVLPSGAIVTGVEASVQPGTANTMALSLYRVDTGAQFDGAAAPTNTQVGATGTSAPSNTKQHVGVGAIAETIDRANNVLVAWIVASAGAGTTADRFYGLRVTFTDPGPRNA